MGLKTLIFGSPEDQGMQYRIRVFDHGHHIKSATVRNRGQNRIDLVVKGKDFGILGDEIKLAFLINPNIPPHYFGNIMEIDFDVRDATQLGDLFEICPDLVYEINQNFHKTLLILTKKESNVIDAEFTEKTQTKKEKGTEDDEDPLTALTDPLPYPETAEEEKSAESFIEKIPGVKTATRIATTIAETPHKVTTTLRGINLLNQIRLAEDEKKQDLIKKTLDFCSVPGNQKCLRWLPQYLHIEPEIMAIVSQTELDGVGILPMYYIKQSTAEISEKMLARPKSQDDWKQTLIYLAFALCLIMGFGVLILKLLGKI